MAGCRSRPACPFRACTRVSPTHLRYGRTKYGNDKSFQSEDMRVSMFHQAVVKKLVTSGARATFNVTVNTDSAKIFSVLLAGTQYQGGSNWTCPALEKTMANKKVFESDTELNSTLLSILTKSYTIVRNDSSETVTGRVSADFGS